MFNLQYTVSLEQSEGYYITELDAPNHGSGAQTGDGSGLESPHYSNAKKERQASQ